MKYWTLLLVLFLMACQNESNDNKPVKLKEKVSTVIQGTIENPNYPNVILESMGEQYQAGLQNGTLSFNLMLDEPKIFNIRYGRRSSQLFVNPGDQLSFTTSANQFSQVMSFTGDRAVENNYLIQKYNNDVQEKSMKVKTYKLEEAEYVAAIKETKDKKSSAFEQLNQTQEMDPYFQHLINTDIEYEWANDMLIYPVYHEFYAKKENYDVSPVYYDFMRTLEKDDPSKLISPNFKSFVSNYLDMEAGKIIESNEELKHSDNGLAITKFEIIEKNFKNEEIIDFLKYNTLATHIKYEGANGTASLLESFNNSSKNVTYLREIEKAYSVWKGLEAGDIAPSFAYNDINGQLHNTEDYKGKYIYVDVWATWCGPCKKELPYLEALQEEYKDNDNILFTSVSIDKDKGAWERMVNDKEMKGLQLFAEGEWRSDIVRDYKITGIPRFLLIDDQGKIISANAPRPSSPKIKAKLEKMVP